MIWEDAKRMKKSVAKLLKDQVNKEFFAAYLYLDFVDFLIARNLDGFAQWYRVQAQEELDHAMLLFDYLHHNNETVDLQQVEKPNFKGETVMDVLKEGLKHEEYVTASINEIYAEAVKEKDFRTAQFLDWFVMEQGEEEANAHELIGKLELIGEDTKGLYILNTELGARVYVKEVPVIG